MQTSPDPAPGNGRSEAARPEGARPPIHTHAAPDCLLCGRPGVRLYEGLRDRLVGVPGTWSHRRCPARGCGLVWLDPMPEEADLGRLYESYFTHAPRGGADQGGGLAVEGGRPARLVLARDYGYPELAPSGAGAWERVRARGPFARERARRSVLWLEGSSRGRLLDVGCGNGKLLDRMRRLGWEVAGVDFDAEAVRVAREHYGLDARHGSVESAGFESESFDAATLEHAIEHVPDPAATLAATARLLRPGGRLVAVTPNVESLVSRLLGGDWYPLDPPRHLTLFSPTSLRRCAESADGLLEDVEVFTCPSTTRSIWGRSRLLRRARRRSGLVEGPPDESGYRYYKKVEGRVVSGVEHLLTSVAPMGEEVVLRAARRSG